MARNIPSAAEAAQRWQTGFSGAGARWAAGIEGVTVAPGQLAAAAQPRYLAGVQASVGKWASRTASVSLAQWKTISVQKGQSRLGSGATAGMPKYQARIATVLSNIASIRDSLPPRGTVEQNIARSSEFQMRMHQASQQGM